MLKPERHVSEADYLEGELTAETKHEYLGGDVYAMTGASDRHNLIIGNLYSIIRVQSQGTGCQLFTSDMKVRLEHLREAYYYYPDLMLACDPDDREPYFRSKPCLLIEVLSESTARVDCREKRLAYTLIPTLRDYVLVHQTECKVEHYWLDDQNEWQYQTLTEGALPLACREISLSLEAIYEEISVDVD